jgi:uncharacterized protein
MATSPPTHNNMEAERSALPSYILLRPEGVFVKLSPPPAQDVLRVFMDRLFSGGAYFKGLDYACFQRLLYGNPTAAQHGDAKEVRLASDILNMLPQRKELYRAVKILDGGARAEYVFEPVFVEITTDEPAHGSPGDDGIAPAIEHKVEQRPVKLDFDEFVADMWTKGVHFGINADAVLGAIESSETSRMNIARQLDPTESTDARVVEENDSLRQDNTPLILPDGRADLRRTKNRFPQVAKDAPLLRKIPRVLGEPGYKVTGEIIEARLPKDLDLDKLGGEGTRIEQSAKGELLVADMDGFIVLDENSGRIGIAKKIENKGGVSAKSTGDIRLDVDEFEEHGEVQEGRIVEGKHMTFHATIFGTVVAQEGNLLLESNISGGCARSMGGDVTINGRAFNATIEAWDGRIAAKFVENCKITGKTVSLGQAMNCEIIADELQVDMAEGCTIVSRQVKIASSGAHRDRETIVIIPVPDFSDIDQRIANAQKAADDIKRTLEIKSHQMESSRANPKLAKIIDLGDKIRTGVVKLTPEQQVEWQRVVDQFAPMMKESAYLMEKCARLEDEIAHLFETRKTGETVESCEIGEVLGETVVRQIGTNQGMLTFRDLPAHELTALLRQPASAKDRIFSGQSGRLEWHFKIPEYAGS